MSHQDECDPGLASPAMPGSKTEIRPRYVMRSETQKLGGPGIREGRSRQEMEKQWWRTRSTILSRSAEAISG